MDVGRKRHASVRLEGFTEVAADDAKEPLPFGPRLHHLECQAAVRGLQ